MSRRQLHLSVSFLCVYFGVASAQGNLLRVDLSRLDTLTISATTEHPAISVFGSDSTGVYLADLFGSNNTLTSFVATAAVGNDLTSFLNTVDSNGPAIWRSPVGPDSGLNVYSWTNDGSAGTGFDSSMQAFSGTASYTIGHDMYMELLASGGRSGDVYFPADNLGDVTSASQIGSWSLVIVPEPSTFSLAGLVIGLASLLLWRRAG